MSREAAATFHGAEDNEGRLFVRTMFACVAVATVAAGCGLLPDEQVELGSCLNRTEASDDGSDDTSRAAVEDIACDRPHDLEVVGRLDASELGADFPGDQALSRWAFSGCVAAFEEYAGTAFGRSTMEIEVAGPSESQWEDGVRSVRCDASTLDGQPRESSIRAEEPS